MYKNLKDKRFGHLTVLEFNGIVSNHKRSWLCKCDCGKIKPIREGNLLSGVSKSCGCAIVDKSRQRMLKHGMSKSCGNHPLYKVWQGIKTRCYYGKSKRYKDYGGRGIKMYDDWRNDFMKFYKWAIENGYKEDLEISRINIDGNYEPNNCRFVTGTANQRNKRNNHLVTINFETKTIADWCEQCSLKRTTFHGRLERGWRGEELLLPPHGNRSLVSDLPHKKSRDTLK